MVLKKKEPNNDMRTLVIKHYQNSDSQRDIASKTSLPPSTVEYITKKYKMTKYTRDQLGHNRKRKTTTTTNRLIQRKLKFNRRKSASIVKTEIENELGIFTSSGYHL